MAEQVGKSYLLGVKTTCSRSRKGMETEPEIPPPESWLTPCMFRNVKKYDEGDGVCHGGVK